MTEIFMPKAGMDMKEGRLIRWLKEVGDQVEKDEPIMEIETDKITMEAEAPGSGILLAKTIEEDTVVPVLAVIGYIGEQGEKIPEQKAIETAKPAESEKPEPAPAQEKIKETAELYKGAALLATPYAKKTAKEQGIDLKDVAPSKDGIIRGRDVLATPLARRVAEDQGIDLTNVAGSGYHGKITRADVERAGIPGGMGCPQTLVNVKVDVTELTALLLQCNEKREDPISMGGFLLKAAAASLGNGAAVGFAVYTANGRRVPVVAKAQDLSVTAVLRELKAYAEKAESGVLAADDCAGAAFSVCSLEDTGVTSFTPVLEPGQAGMFGIGAAQGELALMDGTAVERQKAVLCLSYDRRAFHEAEAAALVTKVKELLENPLEILL